VHELGLLASVVSAVEDKRAALGAVGVERVSLRVGTRSGAVPEALLGAWPFAIVGTSLEEAVLDIDIIEAAVWCSTCQANREIDQFYQWRCPVCDTPTAQLVAGLEFEVISADMVMEQNTSPE